MIIFQTESMADIERQKYIRSKKTDRSRIKYASFHLHIENIISRNKCLFPLRLSDFLFTCCDTDNYLVVE